MEVHSDNTSTGDRVSSSQKKKKKPQTIVHNTGRGAHKIIHIVPEVIQGMGENCNINNYRVGCIQCSFEIYVRNKQVNSLFRTHHLHH